MTERLAPPLLEARGTWVRGAASPSPAAVRPQRPLRAAHPRDPARVRAPKPGHLLRLARWRDAVTRTDGDGGAGRGQDPTAGEVVADQTFVALAGRPWMNETLGCRPLRLVTLIAAASAKVRLVLEPRGTLDCRCEHESQSL